MKVRSFAAPAHAPLLGTESQRFLFGILLFVRELKRPHLGGARGMILAQRMPLPCTRHQNSREVRMPVERDAEHVPRFALVPIGGGTDLGDSWGGQAHLRSSATFSRT